MQIQKKSASHFHAYYAPVQYWSKRRWHKINESIVKTSEREGTWYKNNLEAVKRRLFCGVHYSREGYFIGDIRPS